MVREEHSGQEKSGVSANVVVHELGKMSVEAIQRLNGLWQKEAVRAGLPEDSIIYGSALCALAIEKKQEEM